MLLFSLSDASSGEDTRRLRRDFLLKHSFLQPYQEQLRLSFTLCDSHSDPAAVSRGLVSQLCLPLSTTEALLTVKCGLMYGSGRALETV